MARKALGFGGRIHLGSDNGACNGDNVNITSIKSRTVQSEHYLVFVDGKYSFSLRGATLLEQKLYVGQELTAMEMKRLKQVSAGDELYGSALRYVSIRPRSEWEIRTYLKRKHSPAPLVNSILNKLSKIGLVDDMAFARAWINSRRLLKSPSRRKIFQELRAKHVIEAVISQVLSEDNTNDQVALRELVLKKRQQPRYHDKLKLMQYLARQGFLYDDIKSVVNETE